MEEKFPKIERKSISKDSEEHEELFENDLLEKPEMNYFGNSFLFLPEYKKVTQAKSEN